MDAVIKKYSYVSDRFASVDGRAVLGLALPGEEPFLTALYRALQIEYPKFYKMDTLSKLGFLAAEFIFARDEHRFARGEEVAVICLNRSSSLETDTRYQATIRPASAYFPSPSLFVYTLPNIVTAEIAIRNKLYGETAFYLLEAFDACAIFERVSEAFQDAATRAVLVAWVESFEDTHEAFMMLVESNGDLFDTPFVEESIVELYKRSRNG
ncbi:MAG: hypothetical protein LBP56_03365 [Odoribacteraceae bacterium]|jgi:3-oxoacyl-[acyl-carrier-protein] synthase-1|nr:hypothetical protein [Odoribacteraceae bacterium]